MEEVTINNKKILIADPHKTSRHVISIMLHKLGYCDLLEAGSIDESDKILAPLISKNSGLSGLLGNTAPSEKCDLALMILDSDIDAGGGVEYLETLRKRFAPDKLPVLFTTMGNKDDQLKAGVRAGANDTIIKPFKSPAFAAVLKNLLSDGRAPVIQSFSFGGSDDGLNGTPPKKSPPVPKTIESKAAKMSGDDPNKKAREELSKNGEWVRPAPSVATDADRSAFYRGDDKKEYDTSGGSTARLIDGVIDGHYHEKVDVIGGGQNCFWAKEIDAENVRLEYISAKGRATGMEAQIVPKERFMFTFYLCEEHGCPILDRIEGITR